MKRREFLERCSWIPAAALAPVSGGVRADSAPISHGRQGRILWIIELSGGCDGLNTVIPYRNDFYYSSRPRLAIEPSRVLPLDQELGLHPAMSGLWELFQEGSAAVVNGVGYPDSDRTHFSSRRVWHTAETGEARVDGWLYRLCREAPSPMRAVQPEGLSVPALVSSSVPHSLNRSEPEWFSIGAESGHRGRFVQKEPAAMLNGGSTAALDLLRFENGSGVVFTSLSGFDTHYDQADPADSRLGRHPELLGLLSESVSSFLRTVNRLGRSRQALVMVFSEFGRGLEENRTLGTEHGSANPVILAGGALRGGLFGTCPGLSPKDRDAKGCLRPTVEFQSVYATILEKWFGVAPVRVLDADYSPIDFL